MPATGRLEYAVESTMSRTGADGYVVDGALAAGVTTVTLDGGATGDAMAKGDIISFAGHDNFYQVESGFVGASGNIELDRALEEAVADDAATVVLTRTKVDDFFEDGWNPGEEESQDVPYGGGDVGEDGVKLNGEVVVIGDNYPTKDDRAWIVYHQGADVTVVGGFFGCRIRVGRTNVKPLGGGERGRMVKYSCAGNGEGSCIAYL